MTSKATRQFPAAGWLAAIVEFSDDAIVSKTLDGIITSWNPAAERLFGYTLEEVIGRPISILAAPGRENEMPAILERIRRGEKIEHFETVRRRKDGSLIDVSLTVSPIRDQRGRIVGASKIARDITERKRSRAGPVGERGALPQPCQYRARHRLDGRSGRDHHLRQRSLVALLRHHARAECPELAGAGAPPR